MSYSIVQAADTQGIYDDLVTIYGHEDPDNGVICVPDAPLHPTKAELDEYVASPHITMWWSTQYVQLYCATDATQLCGVFGQNIKNVPQWRQSYLSIIDQIKTDTGDDLWLRWSVENIRNWFDRNDTLDGLDLSMLDPWEGMVIITFTTTDPYVTIQDAS